MRLTIIRKVMNGQTMSCVYANVLGIDRYAYNIIYTITERDGCCAVIARVRQCIILIRTPLRYAFFLLLFFYTVHKITVEYVCMYSPTYFGCFFFGFSTLSPVFSSFFFFFWYYIITSVWYICMYVCVYIYIYIHELYERHRQPYQWQRRRDISVFSICTHAHKILL
jgi:hypothetical protein